MEEEVNNFLLNKHLKHWQAEFFTNGNKAYWTIFVFYEIGLSPEKLSKNLSEPEMLFYQRLREWRKEKAATDGLPVFIIATNQELLTIVKKTPQSIESLKLIRGFGKKKIERYGKELVNLIQAFYKGQK